MIPPDEHFDRGGALPPGYSTAPRTPLPSWLATAFGFVLLACSAALVVAATIAAVRWML